jgi:hypothetical protein
LGSCHFYEVCILTHGYCPRFFIQIPHTMKLILASVLFFSMIPMTMKAQTDRQPGEVRYHHCQLKVSNGRVILADFGENEFYKTETGLGNLTGSGTIVDVLNRMSERGWELVDTMTVTDYFFSTPQTYMYYMLRKRVAIKQN